MIKKGKGQQLYEKAKTLIPGGTMLLSKRPEMFLPENWPSYYASAKGCTIVDLDGNKYVDMSLMGVGTNSLGYGNEMVDAAVLKAAQAGNLSTLNCAEEVYLAERLIEINPWAQMVRFARTGGEANAIAIRIARTCSAKDNVAVCGYHGWHDWYLSVNHNEVGDLSEHLLPGLSPNGVPRNLRNSTFGFSYNDYDGLLEIVEKHDIGVIKMEVMRNTEPKDDFLLKVRELATKKNIVLIFDECSSGFRETFGGLFQKYQVEPDIAIYGKTIGNGYALTAVVGKRSVMESAQKSFISSTFWTERIGPAAALATLNVMETEESWKKVTSIGMAIQDGWRTIAVDNKLDITILGIPAMTSYSFNSRNSLKYKTLITQEMLKNGILGSTVFYACTEHKEEYIANYLSILNDIFHIIKKCENDEIDIDKKLEGPACHAGFKRLN